MSYFIITYIPDGPVTSAIKRKLKSERLRYKLGYLGELMDENYYEARKHNRLLYRPEHLKKLKSVDENPQVVELAFEVLADQLHEKNVALPTEFLNRPPYYPNIKQLIIYTLIDAALMTLAITAIVLYVSNVALMTTLIVLVSVIGAGVFIYLMKKCVIYVDIED
ncbi:MAG: hypothetical protein AAF614_19255 [Chloroflexota bacterium]